MLNFPKFTVNVFGAGGTGSHLIDKLAAVAYACDATSPRTIQLTAWDFDQVSDRNVGRSDFIMADEGMTKTQIAVSKANLAYGLRWRCKNPVSDPIVSANFNFLCTDDAKSRLKYIDQIWALNEHFSPEDQAYYIFDIGNDVDFGQIVMIDRYGKLQDIDRMKINSETEGTPTCGERTLFGEQGLFINQFMALCAAEMFWKLISNYNLEYNQMFVNTGMMKIVTFLKLNK